MFLEFVQESISSWTWYFFRDNTESFRVGFLNPVMRLLFSEDSTTNYNMFFFWFIAGLMFFRLVLIIINKLVKVRV